VGPLRGHLEPGEAPSRAFLREMAEELGWQPRHFEHYLTTAAPPLPGDKEYGRDVVSHVFAVHLDVPLGELTLGEGQAMGLHGPDQLPRASSQASCRLSKGSRDRRRLGGCAGRGT